MSRKPNLTWRQRIQIAPLLVSMAVGLVFGIWGKNPLDPDNLWGTYPQNDAFLWISAAAFFVALIVSYTLWPLVRAEIMRQDMPEGTESPSPWYGGRNRMQISWLAYLAIFPGMSLGWIFGNLAAISHLEMFLWLEGAAWLVAIVVDSVAVVLIMKGFRQRTRERTSEK